MENQALKLIIEKGPRSGETHIFYPTKKPIRLGRVVKGNSFTIKDPSISTQHLTIEFTSSNHWVITDLESSNGTVLNSLPLTPFSPTELRDGDVVKIGEVTVIRVVIEVSREVAENVSGLGFGGELREKVTKAGTRRRNVVVAGSELGGNEKKGTRAGLKRGDDSEVVVIGVENEKKGVRVGTRRGNVAVPGNELGENGVGEKKGLRASNMAESELGENGTDDEKKGTRAGLKRGKVESELGGGEGPGETNVRRAGIRRGKVVVEDSKLGEKNVTRERAVDDDLGEGKGPTRRTRGCKREEEKTGNGLDGEKGMTGGRTRGKKVVLEEESNLGVVEEVIELGFDEMKALEEGKRPRGRSKKEKVGVFAENVGVVEVVEGRGRGRGRMGIRSKRGAKKNETGKASVDEEVSVVAEVFEKTNGRGRGRKGKDRAVEGGELGGFKVELGLGVSTRRTRSMRVVENTGKEVVEASFGGVMVAEKGDNSGGLSVVNVQSGDGLNSDRVVVKSEPRESFGEMGNAENLGTDKEEREERRNCNGFDLGREGCAKNSLLMDRDAPDLTKMTLGDYFDYLEWALPKQIKEETEVIIEEMHKKSEMYREFVRGLGNDIENPM